MRWIEDFAEQVHAYLQSQPDPNFRLNFYVDELGQYVADNIMPLARVLPCQLGPHRVPESGLVQPGDGLQLEAVARFSTRSPCPVQKSLYVHSGSSHIRSDYERATMEPTCRASGE